MESSSTIVLLVFGIISGSAFLVTNDVKDLIPPVTLTALRISFSFLTLTVVFLFYKVWRCVVPPATQFGRVQEYSNTKWVEFIRDVTVLTIFNQVFPYSLYPMTMILGMNVAVSSILSGSTPLLTIIVRKVALHCTLFDPSTADLPPLDDDPYAVFYNPRKVTSRSGSTTRVGSGGLVSEGTEMEARGSTETPRARQEEECRGEGGGETGMGEDGEGEAGGLGTVTLPLADGKSVYLETEQTSLGQSETSGWNSSAATGSDIGTVSESGLERQSQLPSASPLLPLAGEGTTSRRDAGTGGSFAGSPRSLLSLPIAAFRAVSDFTASRCFIPSRSAVGLAIGFMGVLLVASDSLLHMGGGGGGEGDSAGEGGGGGMYNSLLALCLFVTATISKSYASVWAEARLLHPSAGYSPLEIALGQNAAGAVLAWVVALCTDYLHGFQLGGNRYPTHFKFYPLSLFQETPHALPHGGAAGDAVGSGGTSAEVSSSHAHRSVWIGVLYLGMLASAASYLMQFWLIEKIGAVNMQLVNYIVPAVGLVEGVMLLGDWAGKGWGTILLQCSGLTLIFLGFKMIQLKKTEGDETDGMTDPDGVDASSSPASLPRVEEMGGRPLVTGTGSSAREIEMGALNLPLPIPSTGGGGIIDQNTSRSSPPKGGRDEVGYTPLLANFNPSAQSAASRREASGVEGGRGVGGEVTGSTGGAAERTGRRKEWWQSLLFWRKGGGSHGQGEQMLGTQGEDGGFDHFVRAPRETFDETPLSEFRRRDEQD